MKARPASPPRRALLILGMHRSGTSAVARVVNLLGAEIGSELVPPGPDNAKGFWEHAEAVRINDDLLRNLGRTWHDMRDMPGGWLDSPCARSAARRIRKLIERDFGAVELCAVKDPRMCLTAPVWIEAFEAREFEVSCLFVVRDPREVVESLHRRNGWPRTPLYLMWVQYLMEATAASAHRPRTMLSFDQLLSDGCGSMMRVARELHMQWPVAPEGAMAGAVDGFLDAAYRHHPAPPGAEGGEEAAMPQLAARLYQTCLEIASGEGRWEAISELQDSFRAIGQLYGAHVDHLHAGRWDAEGRAQTAEARLASQASIARMVRDGAQELQEKLDARLGPLEQSLEAMAQHAGSFEANVSAGFQEQASATAAVHRSLQQLQDECSAQAGETAARLERQREGIMAVEARIQRQHALLNTISLRLEQAVHGGETERSGVSRPPPPPTELQKLQSALAASNAAIAALLASTSWKVTAPMRWLSVHVLRRPPEWVAAAVEPGPPDAAGARPKGTTSHQNADVPKAEAGPGGEMDRCSSGPEPLAFR